MPPMAAATPSAAITFQLRPLAGVSASSISDEADDSVVEVLGDSVCVVETDEERTAVARAGAAGHLDLAHNRLAQLLHGREAVARLLQPATS